MEKKVKKTLVSVIIPAYKQERTIQKDIQRIRRVLDQLRYNYELIVVVDGFIDETFEKAKKEKSSKVVILGYKKNHGKGFAIRYGMVRAKGDIVGFIDSGMELNPNGISLLLEHFEWYNADIIIGSKRHPVSKVVYPTNRKILSFFSQMFIRTLFGLNVRDTQVGMKFFRKKVLSEILPRLLVKRFAFDIEILAVSYYLGHKRIFEAPVELKYDFKGSIVTQHIIDSVFHTLLDSLAIFYRLKILHYYDIKNKKNWIKDPDLHYKFK